MRRFLLPLLVLAIAITAGILASSANSDATPDDAVAGEPVDSLGSPLLSVRRVPEWLRQPTSDNALDTAASATVANLDERAVACLTVHRDGKKIAAVDSMAGMLPGDLHRIITLGALDARGGSAFTTEVVRSSADVIDEDGVLQGNIWLVGGGDPVLSTDAFISRFDDGRASTSLADLARSTVTALNDAGITSISGAVIGVDPKYDGSPRTYAVSEWPASAINGNEVGGISSLLVDNGFSNFPADTVDSSSNTRASNPTAHAASEFLELLSVSIDVRSGASSGETPAASERVPVAEIDSPTLHEIAARAGSDLTTAEMLYREMTQRSGSLASNPLQAAIATSDSIRAGGYLAEDEIGPLASFDGSGLSPLNQNSCGLITAILDAGEESLAVSALGSVLTSPVAECAPSQLDQLRLLTTERDGVTGMAGRAITDNGDVLTFTVIVNWQPAGDGESASPDTSVCGGVLPSLLDVLGQHPIGPALADLGPLPVSE